MKKTLLFLAVAVLISYVSIMGFKRTYNPPAVEKPVIVEKEVVKEVVKYVEKVAPKEIVREIVREVVKEVPVVKYQVIEKRVPVIEYIEKEKIVEVEEPNEPPEITYEPPVCPRCGKQHW